MLVGIRIGIVALYLKGLYGSRNPIHIGRDISPFKSRAYLELKTLYIRILGLGLRWKMEATRILDHRTEGTEKRMVILHYCGISCHSCFGDPFLHSLLPTSESQQDIMYGFLALSVWWSAYRGGSGSRKILGLGGGFSHYDGCCWVEEICEGRIDHAELRATGTFEVSGYPFGRSLVQLIVPSSRATIENVT